MRWWRQQDDASRARVRAFIASGQLSFVNGGWVMTDEASPPYTDMLLNLEIGHRAILANFGASANPRIAWQIGSSLVLPLAA